MKKRKWLELKRHVLGGGGGVGRCWLKADGEPFLVEKRPLRISDSHLSPPLCSHRNAQDLFRYSLSLSLSSAVEERFRAVCVRAARACAFDAERKKSRRTDGRRWQTFQFECRFLFGSSRVGGWVFSLTFSLYLFRPVLMAAAKFSHNLLSASSLALCVCVCVSVLAAPFLRSLSVCSSGWLYAVPPRRRWLKRSSTRSCKGDERASARPAGRPVGAYKRISKLCGQTMELTAGAKGRHSAHTHAHTRTHTHTHTHNKKEKKRKKNQENH